MVQRVPLRARVEVTGPARSQVVLEAAKESAPDVRPRVVVTDLEYGLPVAVKVIDLEFDLLVAAKATDLEYDHQEVARVIVPAYDLPVVVKGTDLEYDHQEVARVIVPAYDLPVVVKGIDLEYDRQEVAGVTDLKFAPPAMAIAPGVLRDSARRVGGLQAIGHRDGVRLCIARPLPDRPFGIPGIVLAIARPVTGGDRLRQQP